MQRIISRIEPEDDDPLPILLVTALCHMRLAESFSRNLRRILFSQDEVGRLLGAANSLVDEIFRTLRDLLFILPTRIRELIGGFFKIKVESN